MKDKLFRFLFPNKDREINFLKSEINFRDSVDDFEDNEPTAADLMRDSLGLPMIDFADVDEEGKPPHYLHGLAEDERKNFIAELESIYSNERFQKVIAYVINLIGNHSIQKADEDKMRNGRIAIIGIRTLRNEFDRAHSEYLESRKSPDEFDEQEIL